ncbi:hypothetical protein AAY473_027228 [Plecturocebus cupreus]
MHIEGEPTHPVQTLPEQLAPADLPADPRCHSKPKPRHEEAQDWADHWVKLRLPGAICELAVSFSLLLLFLSLPK